jgi:hypothetical protein
MYEMVVHHPDELLPFLLLALLALVALVVTGIVEYRKYLIAKMAHDLKSEMLDRGMSADEIQQVVTAKYSLKPLPPA